MTPTDFDKIARDVIDKHILGFPGDGLVEATAAELVRAYNAGLADTSHWDAFAELLNLHYEQRGYSWHELADAHEKAMAAVESKKLPESPRGA